MEKKEEFSRSERPDFLGEKHEIKATLPSHAAQARTTSELIRGSNIPLYMNNALVEQPRAAVILTHGIGSHSGRNSGLAEWFNRERISVFAFDLPGHGRTRTTKWLFDDFQNLTEALHQIYQNAIEYCEIRDVPLFLFGHSMGGLITLDFVIQFQPRVAGVILSAPALDPGDIVKPWMIRLAGQLRKWFPGLPILKIPPTQLSRDVTVVEDYQKDPLVFQGRIKVATGYEMLTRMQYAMENAVSITHPVLIVQGKADKIVRPDVTGRFFDLLGSRDKTLKLYPEMYHELLKDHGKERVFHDLLAWLEEHIQE
ncbi:MAG TPA: lysophospholipase [Membranihabitans sp.]|nr:lysophospholipase [Membranihabitans sp.]